MRVVDKDKVLAKKQRPKKQKLPTPKKYAGAYASMGQGINSPAYHVRAKDPGATFALHMREANKYNLNREHERDGRAVIFSVKNSYSDMFGAKFMADPEIMGVPFKSLEADLSYIRQLSKNQKDKATLQTFSSRLTMLLGMLGDVTVEDDTRAWDPGTSQILTVKGRRFKLTLLP